MTLIPECLYHLSDFFWQIELSYVISVPEYFNLLLKSLKNRPCCNSGDCISASWELDYWGNGTCISWGHSDVGWPIIQQSRRYKSPVTGSNHFIKSLEEFCQGDWSATSTHTLFLTHRRLLTNAHNKCYFLNALKNWAFFAIAKILSWGKSKKRKKTESILSITTIVSIRNYFQTDLTKLNQYKADR